VLDKRHVDQLAHTQSFMDKSAATAKIGKDASCERAPPTVPFAPAAAAAKYAEHLALAFDAGAGFGFGMQHVDLMVALVAVAPLAIILLLSMTDAIIEEP